MELTRKKRKTYCDPEAEREDLVETIIPLQLGEVLEEFLVKTRRLLIVGEINEISSAHICSYLQVFSLKSDPVYIYINSPGGCLSSGYAIIDQMLACRCPVRTIVRGQGHSMGAIIAAFGENGHRYATPNSSLMLHSIVIHGTPTAIEQHGVMTKYLQEDYNRKIVDLSKRLKLTAKQLFGLMDTTRWMSPKQAIKIGLIDSIWTPRLEQSLNKGFGR